MLVLLASSGLALAHEVAVLIADAIGLAGGVVLQTSRVSIPCRKRRKNKEGALSATSLVRSS